MLFRPLVRIFYTGTELKMTFIAYAFETSKAPYLFAVQTKDCAATKLQQSKAVLRGTSCESVRILSMDCAARRPIPDMSCHNGTKLKTRQTGSGSSIMREATPQNTFRGLPLTQEQDAEVRHYIKRKRQRGASWDTPELKAMLDDMLAPPDDEEGESGETVDETRSATERATASITETIEPIEASEERNAAMEAEGMKGPGR